MSGFIRKLGKQDETKFNKAGILSPNEAAELFSKFGPGMFNTDGDDKDLINSLTGLISVPILILMLILILISGKKGNKIISPEEGAKMMGASDSNSDKDLMASLMNQLGDIFV
jgi:hypothetical protein